MTWDDLRYILAVARHGTIGLGAEALRVNATTMSRRLRALEADAGTALFVKLKHGAVLTAAGHEMVDVAREVEKLTNELDARITGLDAKLEGRLRVTTTETLIAHWLPDFGEFHRRYPDIELELTSTPSLLNLTQREADVAVRLGQQAPEHLIGSKYAQVALAIYGSVELVARVGASAPYSAFPWCGFTGSNAFVEQHAPGASVVLRLDTMASMVDAVDAGLGLALIPCVKGDATAHLRRVGEFMVPGLHLWVLTHPELRGTARIQAFMGFMRSLIARDRDLLEGRLRAKA
jgi:DNA-binding transcriptional LysR family regulator